MIGLMQHAPLLVSSVLEHARKWHSRQQIVSFPVEETRFCYDYAGLGARSSQLAHALCEIGIGEGHAVSIIAWNTHRHLEAWYALSGIGAIAHAVNPRLTPEQAAATVAAVGAKAIFTDLTFAPLAKALAAQCEIECVIVMTTLALMPEDFPALCYEALIQGRADVYDWPQLDENTANAACFTSGTTGMPKGVVYSHRFNVLHALAVSGKDAADIGSRDTMLPAAPMFHANGWGIPYAAPITGARLVLAGRAMDGASLHEKIISEGVTITLGVPTMWVDMLSHIEKSGADAGRLERVVIAGSAAPESMIRQFRERYDVEVRQCWGMTETSPIGTASLPAHDAASNVAAARKQGRPVFGVDIRVIDEETSAPLPHDGTSTGRLQVRGGWVLERYLGSKTAAVDGDGWFDTGDIATINADGVMEITDRAKDLIKSGGEWISSVDLENTAMGHPDVLQAAAIGVPDNKWGERPVLFVVARPEADLVGEQVVGYLADRVAKWWLPDRVIFLKELPLAATGKVRKTKLREEYAECIVG